MPRHSVLTAPVPAAPAAASSGLVSVDGRTFPLKGVALSGRAEGGLADTILRQDYLNPYAEPLEALYTLPLPADGAVIGYTVTIGETVITGEVQPLKKARAAYRKALEEGRTAGLLEQKRADTFSQSLGSVPPGAAVKVEIRVLQPLAFLAADTSAAAARPPRWEYRFPTVAGVRYHGDPGRVPDAADLDAGRADAAGTPLRLDLDLVIADGGAEALAVEAPHHPLRAEPCGDGCRLRLETAARLDRDVVVRWRAASQQVGLRLATGGGLPGDDGRYGLVTVTPPAHPEATFARDLTFLIDASGSMSGEPLQAAKQVVLALLDSLTAADRFEIVAFASRPDRITGPAPRPATPDTLAQARLALAALEAGGCTEMAQAIHEALAPLRLDSQRQVILLSDGYIGFEGEVVSGILGRLQPGCRLHAVGVGAAPNRSLTRGAARAGRGLELFVAAGDDAVATAGQLLAATVAPVLTDIEIGGPAVAACVPARPPDVLAGRPLRAVVELRPAGGELTVKARLAGCDEPWALTLQVPSTGLFTSTLALGALFGREAVADAEMFACAETGGSRLPDAIEALGLRHRIATSRTALVAVAEQPSVDPKAPRRRRKLEVELPAGVSAEGVGLLARDLLVAGYPRSGELLESMPRLELASEISSTRVLEDLATFSAADSDERPRSKAPRGRSVTLGRLLPGRGKTAVQPIGARLVRREDDLLVLEFEVPADGLLLPRAGTSLKIRLGRRHLKGTVDDATTSAAGPHVTGLTLRLGVRLARKLTAGDGALQVSWLEPKRVSRLIEVQLRADEE